MMSRFVTVLEFDADRGYHCKKEVILMMRFVFGRN
jgi:hypothetical protein